MIFGMFLKISNNIYFGDMLHLFLETLPQIAFYTSFFGLMGFAIVYKWTIDFTQKQRCWPKTFDGTTPKIEDIICGFPDKDNPNLQNGGMTPSIINSFATPWNAPADYKNIFFMNDAEPSEAAKNQQTMFLIILLCMVILAITMIVPIPVIQNIRNKKNAAKNQKTKEEEMGIMGAYIY